MKHVIIGGVAGGATAAARIRRADEFAEIILIEKGEYISYANCGLPYYIGGVIRERGRLFVQTAEGFARRFAIDVRTEQEALRIDTVQKTVEIRRKDGTVYTETYDKLLLSPGATPVRPPLPGIDGGGIFTLRNVADTDRIKEYLQTHVVRKAVIVGAGFIGLEMAENLHEAGAEVAVVEMGNQVMAPVDFSIAAQVHAHLIQKGVSLYLEQAVERFEHSTDGSIKVHLKSGKDLDADLVLLSIGVRPATQLAVEAGLCIGEAGGIYVNEFLETSASDVYAVGDAIEYPHPLTGKPYLNYLANPANRQGRIVADNMVFGNTTRYEGAVGTAIAKVFDLTVATTGLAAKRLRQMNLPYLSSTTHGNSHAGYYPDALPLSIKITFNPEDGKLYGGQVVGYDGVDKRIDQIALLLKQGGTIYDLMKIEHAYAPPFSSAKDPLAIAGYVANNILSDEMPIATWRDVEDERKHGAVLLDVRTPEEFAFGSIADAVNIPLDDLRARISELPQDRPILVFCAVGLRGYLALKILRSHGFKRVKNLSGGYKTYSMAVAPVVSPALGAGASAKPTSRIVQVDACGLQCPGPVMKLKQAMDTLSAGEQVEIIATDSGFARDVESWCKSTGHRLVVQSVEKGRCKAVIEKGENGICEISSGVVPNGKTFIMFSDDLDKALATFVLANGAAATGQKTTIFFTFWGLNVIKKAGKPSVKKDFFGRMFGWMLPSDSRGLHLSKMSMFGLGDRMMRHIMKRKGVDSLESLRRQALDAGVEFIACQMSMDVMGIDRAELLDEVEVGGVATYMARAEQSSVNLFI